MYKRIVSAVLSFAILGAFITLMVVFASGSGEPTAFRVERERRELKSAELKATSEAIATEAIAVLTPIVSPTPQQENDNAISILPSAGEPIAQVASVVTRDEEKVKQGIRKLLSSRNSPLKVEYFYGTQCAPELLVGIALAESSLGTNTNSKTPNNAGNVGNTDGGDRRDFNDAERGIKSICNLGVKGTYLKSKRTLWELDGYQLIVRSGGKYSTCKDLVSAGVKYYACGTGSKDWSNTVAWAISQVTGSTFGTDYPL